MTGKQGNLYLCATPIGNLEDITIRVLKTLRQVDTIAAEDTRHTIKLLNYYRIKKPLISYHENNKYDRGQEIIKILKEGKNIALVSDAGTPGISDPGVDLVKLCIENKIKVTALPGPVAAITGLILSGLSTDKFSFQGFLPARKNERQEELENEKDNTKTLIYYEAPHKLNRTLKDIFEIMGNRKIAIARELTKKFEEVIYCKVKEAIKRYEETKPRGEFVIIIEGANKKLLVEKQRLKWQDVPVNEHINQYISKGIERKTALKKVAQDRGISKRQVYALQLEEKGENKKS